MGESSIESSLELINISSQQQPSVSDTSSTDEISDRLLANDFQLVIDDDDLSSLLAQENNLEQLDISNLINSTNDSTARDLLFNNQFSETLLDNDELLSLLDSCGKQEPVEHDADILGQQHHHHHQQQQQQQQLQQLQQSQFIETYDPMNIYPSVASHTSVCSVPVGSSPLEPKAENSIQAYLRHQDELFNQASKRKNRKGQRSNTVAPATVDYILHSGDCQPCTTTMQLQDDYVYQQQLFEYNTTDSKKIQVYCQPRPKFRPRTQNESKTSSHYLRCNEGVKPEYPTIGISQHWLFESDVNLIEVALVALDKLPHPYCLHNKSCSDTYEDNALIFKQVDPNVLYFRLTNEDFQNGYKTFMMELIKSKQDDVITKDLIRIRQLEQSILRFTRIFQVGKGNFQRDEGSIEYSTVMSEAYGDVEVEHLGPRFGPLCGQDMVYVVLKGRILKNDLKLEITEPSINWTYNVENFTKNGNVLYFLMPAFPYPNPQCENIKAYITIYFKNNEIYQSPYLYKGSLDRDLAELNINESNSTSILPSESDGLNPFNFLSAIGAPSSSSPRRTSTSKGPKRLKKKNL